MRKSHFSFLVAMVFGAIAAVFWQNVGSIGSVIFPVLMAFAWMIRSGAQVIAEAVMQSPANPPAGGSQPNQE